MAAVENFEDLRCWQEARKLTALVYRLCEEGKLARDFETRGQIKGASLSTMSNIAEGFGRRFNPRDFIRFLDISQSSSLEVRSISYVLEDAEYLPLEKIMQIREKAQISERMTLAFIRYLRSR